MSTSIRRNKKLCGRSISFSNYNKHYISCINPKPKQIKRTKQEVWVDKNQVSHNYFPDFYLPKFDLYIDPKNPYTFASQLEKIECLKIQLPNLIFLRSLDECENFSLPL